MKTKALLIVLAISLMHMAMAQEKLVPQKNNFKVEIRQVNEIQMVYYEFKGSYMKSFNDFGQLMAYIQQNNIPMGAHALGIFYDDPATVAEAELRSEAGFMVQGPANVTGIYKYKKIAAGKAVSVKYKSMDEISPAYEAISKYIAEKKIKTAPYSIEIYYSPDPNVVDAEILMMIVD